MATDPKEPQQSPDFPDAFYRVTVKGLLVQDAKLMMVEDAVDYPLVQWELPGGGLDFGETDPRDALRREIKEEMGLEVEWIAEKPLYMWVKKRLDRRGMDWYYILALVYPIKVSHLNFIPSDECRSIVFWDKEELAANRDKITDQMHPLIDLFNPADFK